MPHVEADITQSGVGNTVWGSHISNARWQGVRLDDPLKRAADRRMHALMG